MFVIIQSLINDDHRYDNVAVRGPFASVEEANTYCDGLPRMDARRDYYKYEILPLEGK